MDGSISPIPPGTPRPAHPVRGRTQRRRDEEQGFGSALDERAEQEPDHADTDAAVRPELDVGTTAPDEAGRNLDLTA